MMALAAVWNPAAAEQSSAEYVAEVVGATVDEGGDAGGAGLGLAQPTRTRHPTAAARIRRAQALVRQAHLVGTTVPGMIPPSTWANGLVNLFDGAMVCADLGVNLTRIR
jgi:hypothetical protein